MKRRTLHNLLRGASTVLEMMPMRQKPTLFRMTRTDADALRGDWAKVGLDMRAAIQQEQASVDHVKSTKE